MPSLLRNSWRRTVSTPTEMLFAFIIYRLSRTNNQRLFWGNKRRITMQKRAICCTKLRTLTRQECLLTFLWLSHIDDWWLTVLMNHHRNFIKRSLHSPALCESSTVLTLRPFTICACSSSNQKCRGKSCWNLKRLNQTRKESRLIRVWARSIKGSRANWGVLSIQVEQLALENRIWVC